MRDILARCALGLARTYIRHGPARTLRRAAWHRAAMPLLRRGSWTLEAETSFGARMRLSPPDTVQTYIYMFGVWEPAISAWLAGILRPGDTAIDVGANVGYDTLLAADRVGPGGRVRAIEASPALYRALAANVDPVNAAASDRDGTLPVYLHGADNLGGTTVLPDLAAERGARFEAHVRAAPLPALVPVADLLAARAVKIDVEGAEWAVVDGIRDLLPAMRADFLVEATAQGLSAHGRTAADLVGLFEASGYRAWEIENRYDVDAYLDARPPPPRPLAGTDFEQADLLFTRRA